MAVQLSSYEICRRIPFELDLVVVIHGLLDGAVESEAHGGRFGTFERTSRHMGNQTGERSERCKTSFACLYLSS